MSRKQSNTVEYFPHFVNPSKTIFILKSKYGNNGYAFWFQLLELLSRSEGHYYNCQDENQWQYLISYTGVSEQSATEMINLLIKLGKLSQELWECKVIWCDNLVSNFTEVYRKRGRDIPTAPIQLYHNIVTATEIPQTATEIPPTTLNTVSEMLQSKVKQSKVKQSKEENKNLTFEDYIEKIIKPLFPNLDLKVQLEKFNTYWSESDKKVTRPKSAFRNWCERAEKYRLSDTKNNGHNPQEPTKPVIEQLKEKRMV